MKKIIITGAGGFIGHHLARKLKNEGNIIIGIDIKIPDFTGFEDFNKFVIADLRDQKEAFRAIKLEPDGKVGEIYHLAADMGGMGYIADSQGNSADIIYNNSLINLNTLRFSREAGIKKFLFSSSACIYPENLQNEINVKPLKESEDIPAQPQDAYGWEKLFFEQVLKQYKDIDVRVVRFHNIYGEEGTYKGGREKAPAALCRKIIEAKKRNKDYIDIWGDGKQTRSFCYINDCLKGLELIMNGNYNKPINLGRDELISINDLAKLIMKVAGVNLKINHIDGPEGVRGRNSDNSLFKKLYKWEPEINLEEGIRRTYKWISNQYQ